MSRTHKYETDDEDEFLTVESSDDEATQNKVLRLLRKVRRGQAEDE